MTLSQEWKVLIDLEQLDLTPRSVRPLEQQEERESRRLWDPVTVNMMSKNWSEATKQKQTIEQVCNCDAVNLRWTDSIGIF